MSVESDVHMFDFSIELVIVTDLHIELMVVIEWVM